MSETRQTPNGTEDKDNAKLTKAEILAKLEQANAELATAKVNANANPTPQSTSGTTRKLKVKVLGIKRANYLDKKGRRIVATLLTPAIKGVNEKGAFSLSQKRLDNFLDTAGVTSISLLKRLIARYGATLVLQSEYRAKGDTYERNGEKGVIEKGHWNTLIDSITLDGEGEDRLLEHELQKDMQVTLIQEKARVYESPIDFEGIELPKVPHEETTGLDKLANEPA